MEFLRKIFTLNRGKDRVSARDVSESGQSRVSELVENRARHVEGDLEVVYREWLLAMVCYEEGKRADASMTFFSNGASGEAGMEQGEFLRAIADVGIVDGIKRGIYGKWDAMDVSTEDEIEEHVPEEVRIAVRVVMNGKHRAIHPRVGDMGSTDEEVQVAREVMINSGFRGIYVGEQYRSWLGLEEDIGEVDG